MKNLCHSIHVKRSSIESTSLASPPDDLHEDVSIFENKSGLGEDMKFLASMPELCDVTFLVGNTKEPVCAVKAILASRSKYDLICTDCTFSGETFFTFCHIFRFFRKMLYETQSPQRKKDSIQISDRKLASFLKRSSEPLLTTSSAMTQVPFLHSFFVSIRR